jgi:hypothetical protein
VLDDPTNFGLPESPKHDPPWPVASVFMRSLSHLAFRPPNGDVDTLLVPSDENVGGPPLCEGTAP